MRFNLSDLPFPGVIETLDYEIILQRKIDKLKKLEPAWDADIESDPALKILQASAYSEIIERQRVNDSAKAVMLPWSKGTDLENLAALFKLKREIIISENSDITQTTSEVLESDQSLSERCLLAWHGLSTAGPRKSYIFHARSASSQVKDANAYRIKGGQIALIILAHSIDGAADEALLAQVENAISDEDVRPLCSSALVKSALIHEFKLTVTLDIELNVAYMKVLEEAKKKAWEYVNLQHKIGGLISESALKAALHTAGVRDVDLHGFTTIRTDKDTAPFCYAINVDALNMSSVCK